MLVKINPVRGTRLWVWEKKKYYPGEIKNVDEDLGAVLIKRGIAVEHVVSPTPPDTSMPPPVARKRGPGRPRKHF